MATAAEVGAGADGRVDLGRLLAGLFDRDRRHVLLEGGPSLAAAMLAAGLVDRVVAYVAPAVLGAGTPAVADLGIATLADARRFVLTDVTRVGADARLTLEPLS